MTLCFSGTNLCVVLPEQHISQTKSSVFGLGAQHGFGDDFGNQFTFLPRNNEGKLISTAIKMTDLWAIIYHEDRVLSAVHAACYPDSTIFFEYLSSSYNCARCPT